MSERIELEVGTAEVGRRLDSALGALSQIGSRAAAQRLIDDAAVTVDGERRAKSHVLSEGERVVVTPQAREMPAPADPSAPNATPLLRTYVRSRPRKMLRCSSRSTEATTICFVAWSTAATAAPTNAARRHARTDGPTRAVSRR